MADDASPLQGRATSGDGVLRPSILCVTESGEDVPAPLREAAARLGLETAVVEPAAAHAWIDPGAGAIAGVIALGARAARGAARVAAARGLEWHAEEAVRVSTTPLAARGRLLAAGVPVPWFVTLAAGATLADVAAHVGFPCLIGPAAAFPGPDVHRVADAVGLESAVARLRETRAPRRDADRPFDEGDLLIEGIPPGRLATIEGVLERGALRVFAMFEEAPAATGADGGAGSVWASPPSFSEPHRRAIATMVARSLLALGLHHGPIHAECRVGPDAAWVVTVEPWPLTGEPARALRFATVDRDGITFDELLVRHAVGAGLDGFGLDAEPIRVARYLGT